MLNVMGSMLTPEYPRLHSVSRHRWPAAYPARLSVPDEKVHWETEWPEYYSTRVDFTAPSVLANFPNGWAHNPEVSAMDPARIRSYASLSFDASGYPLNPAGRTGIGPGRGLLGHWGANFAADPILTWYDPKQHQLFLLAIERGDGGGIALPGGMADFGEAVGSTLTRELGEETGVKELRDVEAIPVYAGYVDDWRNTDHAWMETLAAHYHVPQELAATWKLKAGDDAKKVFPLVLEPGILAGLYASHGLMVRRALEELMNRKPELVEIIRPLL